MGRKIDIAKKREDEKIMVAKMIRIYCKKKHGQKNDLCEECKVLKEYAWNRSDNCPFMESKTFCSNCKVHCYKFDMREKIKDIMRFAGPRMIFVEPIAAIRHVIETKKEKKRLS